MTTLARSASLADLDVPQQGQTIKEDKVVKTISHRTSNGGAGGSTNWKWLQNSKSFHENRLISPSTQSFFAPSVQGPTPSSKTSDSTATTAWKQKATNLLYLEHLETLLPQYCQHLSNPTYQEAANAMSLLLNSNYPRLPTDLTSLSPGSPDKQSKFPNRPKERDSKTTVTSEMNRLLSSPFRVRKLRRDKHDDAKPANSFRARRWSNVSSSRSMLSSQTSNTTLDLSHHSIKHNSFFNNNKADQADAAAWNDFVAPLVLLAGAEAIYADLEHVHPNPTTIKWTGLYERVATELQARLPVEEVPTSVASPDSPLHQPTPLLPPNSPPKHYRPSNQLFQGLLVGGNLDEQTPKATIWASDGTKSEHKRLRSLCYWLDAKLKWLPFHESVYTTWNLDNLMHVRAFAAALPAKDSFMDGSGHLMEALRQEIEATLALMEMGFSLERGRFLETICMARKVKQHLGTLSSKETALTLWMRTTFQDYLAIMALVFDKIHTFSMPLYGFDQQIILEATQGERTFLSDKKAVVDLDHLVIEFLRRQDKAGGTATAVAVVLDTVGLYDEQTPASNAKQQRRSGETDQSRHHHRVELGFALRENLKQRTTPSGFPIPSKSIGSQRQQQQQVAGNAPQERDENTAGLAEPKMWPAVYLRTSMRLASQARNAAASNASAGIGLISGMRRSANSRGSGLLEGPTASQHGSGLLSQSRAASDGSPRGKFRKGAASNRNLVPNGNIFEYETEPSDRPSWPHSEWVHLRAFLDGMKQGTGTTANDVVSDRVPTSTTGSPQTDGDTHLASPGTFEEPFAVTLQPDGGEPEDSGAIEPAPSHSLLSAGQIWDPLPAPSSLSLRASPQENSVGTTFHAVLLTDFMWMIVMVKGEEQSRWHRKSRGLPDNEIREFLNNMASKLRISNRFLGLKTCQTARVKVKDPLAPRVRGRDLGLREAQWQSGKKEDDDSLQDEVVELMKEAFSVSRSSAIMNRAESILTSMSGGFRPGSRSPCDRRRVLALKNGNSEYREGAAMLFLGPELYRQFLESTHE